MIIFTVGLVLTLMLLKYKGLAISLWMIVPMSFCVAGAYLLMIVGVHDMATWAIGNTGY